MSEFPLTANSRGVEIDFDEICNLFRKYNVDRAYIFGSYINGAFTEVSDLDFIIVPPDGMGYDFYSLWDDLEAVTNKPVDLISEDGLTYHIDQAFAKRVFNERICIYDRGRNPEEVRQRLWMV